MKRIVILISGSGSNMLAIAEAFERRPLAARIVAVVCNRPDAPGLRAAAAKGLSTEVIDHTEHPDRESFDAALQAAIDAHAPDLVVLAGFMRILTAGFVRHFQGRLVNIHPSLLPAFPGLKTHARALEAGCKLAGATVHLVTEALDHGPILAQAVVPIRAEDDAESLAARVLAAEHRMYPEVLRWLVEDSLHWDGDRAWHRGGAPQLFT